MSGFRTKLDFSDNRQAKQRPITRTVLSGSTSFGLPFNLLPSGPNLTTTAITENYTYIASTFSGNNTTTIYNWSDPRMELAINSLSALTTTTSGFTQDTGIVWTPNSTTTIDDNVIALTYSGVSFDISVVTMVELSAGIYSGTITTNNFNTYSASTLDYTGRTIWVDVSGITRTEKLIITKNPQIGYVWTCVDSEGNGEWSFNGTGSTVTAELVWTAGTNDSTAVLSGSNSTASGQHSVAQGYQTLASGYASHAEGGNTIASGNYSHVEGYGDSTGYSTASGIASHAEGKSTLASGDYSHAEGGNTQAIGDYSHAEGYYTIASGVTSHAGGSSSSVISDYSFIHSFNSNIYANSNYSAILGGDSNTVINSAYSSIIGGELNTISGHTHSFIGGGYNNLISCDANYNAIIGGQNNLNHASNGVIIGGTNNSLGSDPLCPSKADNSVIIGGSLNFIASTTNNTHQSIIIGGFNNRIDSTSGAVDNTVILGGTNITATTGNMVYVPDLTIDGLNSTDPIATDASGKIVAGTSDIRLKQNVNTLTNSLNVIKNLRGVSFEYTPESNMGGGIRYGFIAQEVKEHTPLIVRDRTKGDGMLSLNYNEIVPILVEAVKELAQGSVNNSFIETQTILAEDNNIELNYNGTQQSSIGGGLRILHAKGNNLSTDLITDENGDFVTNNDFKPQSLTIPYFTPTSTIDVSGNEGNITRDDEFLYIKTSTGWKRTNLENF
jgi:hypothetical protein